MPTLLTFVEQPKGGWTTIYKQQQIIGHIVKNDRAGFFEFIPSHTYNPTAVFFKDKQLLDELGDKIDEANKGLNISETSSGCSGCSTEGCCTTQTDPAKDLVTGESWTYPYQNEDITVHNVPYVSIPNLLGNAVADMNIEEEDAKWVAEHALGLVYVDGSLPSATRMEKAVSAALNVLKLARKAVKEDREAEEEK